MRATHDFPYPMCKTTHLYLNLPLIQIIVFTYHIMYLNQTVLEILWSQENVLRRTDSRTDLLITHQKPFICWFQLTDVYQKFLMSSLSYRWPSYQIWSLKVIPFLRYPTALITNKNLQTDGKRYLFRNPKSQIRSEMLKTR